MIDINNESGLEADEHGLVALATYTLHAMGIHPQSDLAILLVDEQTMADYHQRFMGLPGPTDVLSFPMDELRIPHEDDEPPLGLLGDIVLCPAITQAQAADYGRTSDGEAEYLLVHGILHLLGFDHAEEKEKAEMFALQDQIIAAWDAEGPQQGAQS